MRQRISVVSESNVTECRPTFRGHCRLTLAFSFVDTSSRSGDLQCRVWKSQKSGQRLMFLHPEFGEGSEILEDICKSTPCRPTGLVWLRSHDWCVSCVDEIKRKKK